MRITFWFLAISVPIEGLIASQTYVPPPPPTLPAVLSPEAVKIGERLFLENVLASGKLEIHNYLGAHRCGSCHDEKTPLQPDSLAQNFSKLRDKINEEIVNKGRGTPLPLQDPAMESLVQYIVQRYKLYDHKLLK